MINGTRVGVATLVLGVAFTVASGVAFALGSNSGELGAAGGRAVGDISKAASETDSIGLDLVAGERLDLKLKASFAASLVLLDPDGFEVPLGVAPGGNVSASVSPVAASGRHELRIAAADGSQGTYKLKAKAGWEKKQAAVGDGETSFEVWMPAGGKLKGAFKSSAGDPSLVEILDPSGAQVVGPASGKKGKLKLRTLRVTEAGRYVVTVGAGGPFTGTFVRSAPKPHAAKLKLSNGLTEISFAADGVGDLFKRRCATCHSWAGGYPGVRGFATQSYGRMKSGNMPKGGARISREDLALVEQWIKTGRNR